MSGWPATICLRRSAVPQSRKTCWWVGGHLLSQTGAGPIHWFPQQCVPPLIQLRLSRGAPQGAQCGNGSPLLWWGRWGQTQPFREPGFRCVAGIKSCLLGRRGIVLSRPGPGGIKKHSSEAFLSLARCSPDQVLVCDPLLESEAREDTACGMITDPTGTMPVAESWAS